MSEPESDQGDESIFDSDGKAWHASRRELEEAMGDEIDEPVREHWEALEEIGMLNVRRNDAGEPVTAQLSQFAVDLFELPEDARIDEHVAVYIDHGKEPPEELREEYFDPLDELAGQDDLLDDALIGGDRRV